MSEDSTPYIAEEQDGATSNNPSENERLTDSVQPEGNIDPTSPVEDQEDTEDVPEKPEAASPDARPRWMHDIARVAHEVNRAYCAALGDDSQPAWEEAPDWQRSSVLLGVELHIKNPNTGPAASHQSWMAQKINDGWVYGESKDPEAKTHPCLVPFEELPVDQQAKDYIFRAVVYEVNRMHAGLVNQLSIAQDRVADGQPNPPDSVLVELEKLRAFKAYVHQRLDSMRVPFDPNEEQTTATGCRVGARFDYLSEAVDRERKQRASRCLSDQLISLRAEVVKHAPAIGAHYDRVVVSLRNRGH